MEHFKKECIVETKTVNNVYDDDEREKDICDSLRIEVKEKKPSEENVFNKCFEYSQSDGSIDVVTTSEGTSDCPVTVVCKSLREDEPKDVSHKDESQEDVKENCTCDMKLSNSVDDEHVDTRVSKPVFELSDQRASSNKDREISDDSKVAITLEDRGKNIQGFGECMTELQNKREGEGEVVVNGVGPNLRTADAVSESLALKNIIDPGNETVEIKQLLHGEEKTVAKFENKRCEIETKKILTEINDETRSDGEVAHKPDNDFFAKETTNGHHALFDTDEHTDSDLHFKHTEALCMSVNKNVLNARDHQDNSVSIGSSIVAGSSETTVEESQFHSPTENVVAVKENQFPLCHKDEEEAKVFSSTEICDNHKPILDDNENDELRDFENLNISSRKIKLSRQRCVEWSVANTENNELAPTPPGAESSPSHTNTSCEQMLIPSSQGSSQEEKDSIEDKDKSSNKVQIAGEAPLTNALSSGADQTSSSDHDHTSEQSEGEIPLATKRLLARFPKKLVKTLSNPPGVVVERDAAHDIISPDAALVHAYKSTPGRKTLLRKSKSEPCKEEPPMHAEVRHRSFVDSLLKKLHKGVDQISSKVHGESTKSHTVLHNENAPEANTTDEVALPRTESDVTHKSGHRNGHEKSNKITKFFGSPKRRSEKRAKRVMSVIEESSRLRNDDFEDFDHIQMYLAAKETLHK